MKSTVDPGNPLWAITSYFNPSGYQRRLANYRLFRRELAVPLLAVELTFGDAPPALSGNDADIVMHCTDGDVMWQKERLLNLALARLPASCRYVAWIDCDVIFPDARWADAAVDTLAQVPLVQLFSTLDHAPRDVPLTALRGEPQGGTQTSFMALAHGQGDLGSIVRHAFDRTTHGTPALGMAWAARRELLQAHGLYDRCIVGGGDTALMCAAMGCPELVMEMHHMNDAQRAAYLRWALPFHADVKGRVSPLPGVLHHLWHGDLADRQARKRHQQLRPHDYDPAQDLAPGRHGAWRWATDKPSLHSYVRGYFSSRHEDGRPAAAST